MPKISKLPQRPIKKQRTGPLWRGPCDQSEFGGVTQSMLGGFLCDRERFRVKYVEGLRPVEGFNHFLEYGQLWHACEEAHAAGLEWQPALDAYARTLLKRYPFQQEQVTKWYMACKVQYPIYVDYWKKHRDVTARKPLMQEQVFDVPYSLPSGRVVRLRGKFDAVDLVGKGKDAGVYLFENKTKSDIDEEQLKRQLHFDLQTMMYLVALHWMNEHSQDGGDLLKGDHRYGPIRGVRYNVIRRPLSGGKGSIKQLEGSKGSKCPKCKEEPDKMKGCPKCGGAGRINPTPAESTEDYYRRLQQYFIDEPEYWFMRWNALITPEDVKTFRRRFLDPILEQLCDWYEHVTTGDPWREWLRQESPAGDMISAIHWQHPFGVRNILDEGGATDLDNYLLTGSDVGLHRVDTMFTELQ